MNPETTKIQGTITEQHADLIADIFQDDELNERVANAEEGSLFLNLLFNV